ncbi:MAG: uracil-DNA glycosylase family protein, partial [Acinetobacter sp.]
QVVRLKGNAADKFLQIETPTDIKQLLVQMPNCHNIMTTGDKATDTLMLSMPETTEKPQIGHSSKAIFADRNITLYRMPSSSRAYPLALDKKAEAYHHLFKEIGLL